MNKVILIGRLARDPELRSTSSGTSVSKFTLAVNRGKDQDGNDRGADFISCIAWRKLAENIAKYCTKGSQMAIEGRIQTGSYDAQDGTKRYTTDVVVETATFLGSRQQSGQETGQQFSTNQEAFESAMSETSEDPFSDFGSQVDISDEDLPF